MCVDPKHASFLVNMWWYSQMLAVVRTKSRIWCCIWEIKHCTSITVVTNHINNRHSIFPQICRITNDWRNTSVSLPRRLKFFVRKRELSVFPIYHYNSVPFLFNQRQTDTPLIFIELRIMINLRASCKTNLSFIFVISECSLGSMKNKHPTNIPRILNLNYYNRHMFFFYLSYLSFSFCHADFICHFTFP